MLVDRVPEARDVLGKVVGISGKVMANEFPLHGEILFSARCCRCGEVRKGVPVSGNFQNFLKKMLFLALFLVQMYF